MLQSLLLVLSLQVQLNIPKLFDVKFETERTYNSWMWHVTASLQSLKNIIISKEIIILPVHALTVGNKSDCSVSSRLVDGD